MKNEDSWIKQKNVVKSKQLPWFGKLNNKNQSVNQSSNNDHEDETRIIYRGENFRNLNKNHETVPKSSTSSSSECSKSLSVFPNITNSQQLCSNQLDTLPAQVKLDSGKIMNSSKNDQNIPSWRKNPIHRVIESENNSTSTSLPNRQWPPPKNSNTSLEKEEDEKNWSLDQNERNNIKLKLENFIGGAKRRMDDNDKENKVVQVVATAAATNEQVEDDINEKQPANQKNEIEVPKKAKNITKETLMKLLEAEREEQSAIEPEISAEVIKCGLPAHQRPTERENNTDVEKCIKQLRNNDPTLKEVNLNNMKRTPVEVVRRLLEATKENTHLKKLSFVNMGLNDAALETLLEVVEMNSCLESINLETNYLSGAFLSRLFQSCLKLQTLQELKVVNQSMTLGNEAELSIMRSVFQNRGFYKVSVDLRLPEARQKVDQTLIRNGELRRLKRKIDEFDLKKD